MPDTILPTTNTDWGFFGTMADHADPAEAWKMAMLAIQTATGCPDTAVRDFLDSTFGRHFADDVANGLFAGKILMVAVDATVARWMAWTISRRTARETGIPHGLPYLTGFATHFEILADAS
ncbi:hypothetical protein H261_10577 [Paramagnetospirillum caucaseum]|uniref:Uncharacterized protein n=1 Tax=Paramagnetospirillum caucaseum TaxID=1244869 RepID=M3AB01_9PROT|nr:hypothetical protein [Paramagnetospirillum caucaseum]EME69988.1 hypothetical protein H261_10577 [Paramagnetospirillum caucaseum]